jgi:hypothetical protein
VTSFRIRVGTGSAADGLCARCATVAATATTLTVVTRKKDCRQAPSGADENVGGGELEVGGRTRSIFDAEKLERTPACICSVTGTLSTANFRCSTVDQIWRGSVAAANSTNFFNYEAEKFGGVISPAHRTINIFNYTSMVQLFYHSLVSSCLKCTRMQVNHRSSNCYFTPALVIHFIMCNTLILLWGNQAIIGLNRSHRSEIF